MQIQAGIWMFCEVELSAMEGKRRMKKLKNKVFFYKALLAEIVETLCSICLYLESEGRMRRNPQSMHMQGHFRQLKDASSVLREELSEEWKKNVKTRL